MKCFNCSNCKFLKSAFWKGSSLFSLATGNVACIFRKNFSEVLQLSWLPWSPMFWHFWLVSGKKQFTQGKKLNFQIVTITEHAGEFSSIWAVFWNVNDQHGSVTVSIETFHFDALTSAPRSDELSHSLKSNFCCFGMGDVNSVFLHAEHTFLDFSSCSSYNKDQELLEMQSLKKLKTKLSYNLIECQKTKVQVLGCAFNCNREQSRHLPCTDPRQKIHRVRMWQVT